MAKRIIDFTQTDLERYLPQRHPNSSIVRGDPAPDILEFRIDVVNPESGNFGTGSEESLSLQGTHLPLQPFESPVSQEVVKVYYPGGPAERVPTVQILGSMDDDVTLRGVFKATKIYDIRRRDEPLKIDTILKRLVREGNVCRVQLGHWIRFVILTNYRSNYYWNAKIGWELSMTVIGTTNPMESQDAEALNLTKSKIFADEELKDFNGIREFIGGPIDEARQALAGSYLPDVGEINPFNLAVFINRLREHTPLGGIIQGGVVIYNTFTDIVNRVNQALDYVDDFNAQVDRTAQSISRTLLQIRAIRSRIYRSQQNLLNSLSLFRRSGSSFTSTISRIRGINAFGITNGMINSVQQFTKDIEDNIEREEANSVEELYVVKPGDSLQSISTRFYGSFDRWNELKRVNELTSNELTTGQQLIIPR